MAIYTPEIASKIAIWRQKSIDGTLSLDEMKEAIVVLRAGRISASYASATARQAKAKTNIPNAMDLLATLKGTL